MGLAHCPSLASFGSALTRDRTCPTPAARTHCQLGTSRSTATVRTRRRAILARHNKRIQTTKNVDRKSPVACMQDQSTDKIASNHRPDHPMAPCNRLSTLRPWDMIESMHEYVNSSRNHVQQSSASATHVERQRFARKRGTNVGAV
jgi:hypothetical protein